MYNIYILQCTAMPCHAVPCRAMPCHAPMLWCLGHFLLTLEAMLLLLEQAARHSLLQGQEDIGPKAIQTSVPLCSIGLGRCMLSMVILYLPMNSLSKHIHCFLRVTSASKSSSGYILYLENRVEGLEFGIWVRSVSICQKKE